MTISHTATKNSSTNIFASGKATASRLAHLDNLKAFLAVLVVMHHAGQPYGPTGGAWPIFHQERFFLLGPFFHTNASFFMGLFFLISAYFLPKAFERKGAQAFLTERFRRLGIPVMIFGLGIAPLYKHLAEQKAWSDCFLPFEWAHLWFLGHLMIYSLLYAAYRLWRGSRMTNPTSMAFPGNLTLLTYAIGLAVVDLVVRNWFPIDFWGRFIVTAEIAHLPQYASLFLFGLLASKHGWLENIPRRTGRLWLGVAIAAVIARFSYTLAHADFISNDSLLADVAWNLWEALICVGMCVGLPYWFSRFGNGTSRFVRFAGRSAFAMYVVHLPVLVIIQKAMEQTSLGPLELTIITGSATILICYGLSALYELLWNRKARSARPSTAVA